MPREWRKRLDESIYEDNHGWEIIVRRNGKTGRKRVNKKKHGHHTLGQLRAIRTTLIDDLKTYKVTRGRGSLHGDVAAYLATLPAGRMKNDRANELNAWVAIYGKWPRKQITSQIVRGQLAQWQTEGRAASTLNHRRQALKSLYRALDGPEAPTPCDHVPKAVERREIRNVPPVVVAAILRRVPNTQNGARIKVIARTGLPHAQLGRVKPSDIDSKHRTLHVTPRRKGAGTKARTIPITHAAVRAFALMARHEAWGPFSNSSLHKVFQQAVQDAKKHWPKGKRWPAPATIRPYDLRHAFLTEVYRRTRDLRATAELGLHANMTMTARYAEAAVSATAAAARDLMDGTSRKSARK